MAETSEVTGCMAKKVYWMCRKIKTNFMHGNFNRLDINQEPIPDDIWLGEDSRMIGNCIYWFTMRKDDTVQGKYYTSCSKFFKFVNAKCNYLYLNCKS